MTTPTPILIEFAQAEHPVLTSYSPFCEKVHRALRIAGISYTSRFIQNPNELKKINARLQAPVLEVGGQFIADSTEIMRWIETQRPGSLLPEDPRMAAGAWLWEEMGDTTLNGFLLAARWADEDNWARSKPVLFRGLPAPLSLFVPGLVRKGVLKGLWAKDFGRGGWPECWERFGRFLDQMEANTPVDGFWVGTPKPSVADVALFAQLQGIRTDMTPVQRDMVEARPKLTAWLDRVHAASTAT